AGGHGERFQPAVIAGDDVFGAVAVIDVWLEDLDSLPGDDRAPQPANELLRFSGEHASGDDFDPAAFITVQRFASGVGGVSRKDKRGIDAFNIQHLTFNIPVSVTLVRIR